MESKWRIKAHKLMKLFHFSAWLQQAGAEEGDRHLSRSWGQERLGQLVQEGRATPLRRGEPHPGKDHFKVFLSKLLANSPYSNWNWVHYKYFYLHVWKICYLKDLTQWKLSQTMLHSGPDGIPRLRDQTAYLWIKFNQCLEYVKVRSHWPQNAAFAAVD